MLSPARKSHLKKLAAQSGSAVQAGKAAPMPESGPVASEYQLQLAALGIDLNALRQIQSTERKIEAKRQMIETYRPWVEGAMEAQSAAQDEIVSTMLVWAIDIHDWPLALALAAYVITHGIALPERYNRTVPTLVAEEMAEIEIRTPGTVPMAVLSDVAQLVKDCDIFDQVRAKLYKAQGLSFKFRSDHFDAEAENAVAGGKNALLTAAVCNFDAALALDAKCGVKKLIQQIESELKKLAAEKTPAENAG